MNRLVRNTYINTYVLTRCRYASIFLCVVNCEFEMLQNFSYPATMQLSWAEATVAQCC